MQETRKKSRREKRRQKAVRYLVGLIVMLSGAFFIEMLGFNAHPLLFRDQLDYVYTSGDGKIDPWITLQEEKKEAVVTLSEPSYIRKFYLYFQENLTEDEKIPYTLTVTYVNQFGRTEECEIKDVYYPEIGVGITRLDKKISKVQIAYTGKAPQKISQIHLVTKTAVNQYRFLFWMMVIGFFLFYWWEKAVFFRCPEKVMAVSVLVMGCFIIFSQGINENGWDEEVHFRNAYNLSYYGSKIETSKTYEKMVERIPITYYNTQEEKEMATYYLNENFRMRTETAKQVPFGLNQLAYGIQAGAIALGRGLDLEFNQLYMLGKLANLLTYVLIMYVAIRIIPFKKTELAALAMIPTQVFVAGSYTYDVCLNALLFLGFALWMKMITEKEQKYILPLLLGCVTSFVLGCLAKAVYIPIVLLGLLIPREMFKRKHGYRMFWGCVAGVSFVGICTFAIPMVVRVFNNEVGVMTDGRLVDVDAVLLFLPPTSFP